MGISKSKTKVIPIVPLPKDHVVLPGVTLRLRIAGRADIAALLAHIYSKAATPKTDPVIIGCVPVKSPYLNGEGRMLIEDGDNHGSGEDEVDAADAAEATADDLFSFGALAKVTDVQGRRKGEIAFVVEGLQRLAVQRIVRERPFFEASVLPYKDEETEAYSEEVVSKFGELKQLSREFLALVRLSSLLPRGSFLTLSPLLARRLELFIARKDVGDAGSLADFLANVLDSSHEEKLRILAALSIRDRLDRVIEVLRRQISTLQGTGRVLTITTSSAPVHSDFERMRRMHHEVLKRGGVLSNGTRVMPPGGGGGGGGDVPEEQKELEELRKRLDEAKLTPDAEKVARRELVRLQKMNPAQAEYQVSRNYLENLAEIPWTKATEDFLDSDTLGKARKQLDDDHYGLEKIKKRLLEYLAVLKLKQSVNVNLQAQIKALTHGDRGKSGADDDKSVTTKIKNEQIEQDIMRLKKKRFVDKSPIILLVGPPGTGKTSLAKSVATALGRQFHRISLGGVRDEAEIRGHRRTYVAAMPGLIVNGLKKVGVTNPVFLLDEIDKLGTSNFHGDPSAAMLEVLDPEQNHSFVDHYVNIPIDLSRVLFIATANSLDTIPAPLLDRMEMIQLSGYTALEKRHIATRHLIPKQIHTNGLAEEKVQISVDALDKIITSYTRESGVRNLEREIGSVCRSKAVEFAEAKDSGKEAAYVPTVTVEDLEDILGIERFDEEIAEKSSRPGVVTGLVAFSTGGQGSILFIEIADMPGTGRVQLTGKLGDVLKESVEVALTWVKAHAFELALTLDPNEDIMKNRSIHVHCPSGAIPKDGPSAGLAHTIALISLFSGKAAPPTIAMTGEVSLRGKVTPVGGIKEKLIGALRAGVKTVMLPVGNKKDVKDLPVEVKEGLEIIHVQQVCPFGSASGRLTTWDVD